MQNNEMPTTLPQENNTSIEVKSQNDEKIEVKAGNDMPEESFGGEANIVSDNQSSKVSPKFKTLEDQAKAYLEAEKALTRKSQELSEVKKELDSFKNSFSKNQQNQDLNQNDEVKGQFGYQNILDIERLEKIAQTDYKMIANLCRAGVINQSRANNLKKYVDVQLSQEKQKIFSKFRSESNPKPISDLSLAVDEFCSQNPGFFESGEREKVLNYLKKSSDSISKNDLEAIADLIQSVEKSAIEYYKKALEKKSFLQSENNKAKSKLTSISDANNNSSVDSKKFFTRAEIRRMSKQEFEKNEALIMDQMRKGLIK